jgi:hypothetical protein
MVPIKGSVRVIFEETVHFAKLSAGREPLVDATSRYNLVPQSLEVTQFRPQSNNALLNYQQKSGERETKKKQEAGVMPTPRFYVLKAILNSP